MHFGSSVNLVALPPKDIARNSSSNGIEKYAIEMNKSETKLYLAKLLPESHMLAVAQRQASIEKQVALGERQVG